MLSGWKKFQKFSNSIVYLAVILFAGVLTMSYGVYNRFNPALYVGLGVTIIASYYGILRVIVLRKS
jgi:hypothetical protein